MLISIYIFTLVVGAVLLGASILLGGKGGDADGDAGGDADGGVDKEVESPSGADVGGFLTLFLSLRFWVFFLAFFGLTGLVLELLDLVGHEWATLAIALSMGLGVGVAARLVMRKLGGDTRGNVVESAHYVGKMARVMVPFEGQGVGRVRVEVKGTTVDLLASGLEDEAFTSRDEVLIVEMDGSRARVARVNGGSK